MLLAAYLQGMPSDLVHAAAAIAFLLIISRPMLGKLDRIKEQIRAVLTRRRYGCFLLTGT